MTLRAALAALCLASAVQASPCRLGPGTRIDARFTIDFVTSGKRHTVRRELHSVLPAQARVANGGKRLVAQFPAIRTGVPKNARARFDFVPVVTVENYGQADCSLGVQALYNSRVAFAEAKTDFAINSVITVNGKTTRTSSRAYVSCFDGETRIALADGKSVAIRGLVPGDVVRNPITKAAVRVRNVIRGEEFSGFMVEADLGGGRSVLMTANHPVPTARGLVAAKDLRADDRLAAEGGAFRPLLRLSRRPIDRMRNVYNLELDADSTSDQDHFLLANGIVAGDWYLQHRLEAAAHALASR